MAKKMKVTPELIEALLKIANKDMPDAPKGKDHGAWYQNGRSDGEIMLARMVLRTLNATLLD